jgi:acylphosphatase
MKVRVQLKIEGWVQGVFFRQSTCDTALRLGLTGWVRNCPDGSVEAVFEGEETAVQEAIDWCHQGPPAAQVTSVKQEWSSYSGEFKGFRTRY